MKRSMMTMKGLEATARWGLAVLLATLGLARSPLAHADQLLLADTTMVSGTSSATFSFNAPSSGMVTARIASLPWPVPLASLSFSASNTSNTLSAWASSGPVTVTSVNPQIETFQVGTGTYFAHVSATAGGADGLNLGLYSLMLTFTPVPLPGAAGLLLIGIFVVLALRSTLRSPRNESVMYPA